MNGSPAKEFDISRGISVSQGDPLSPFLFIFSMKGLHISIKVACELHYFRGLSLPHNNISFSHLICVDDVIFISE